MPPWVFDVIILAVIVLSAVMSAGRGLIRETFSIIAFIVGLLVAWLCIRFGQAPLKEMISPDEPSIVPAMILFLAGFLVSYAHAALVAHAVFFAGMEIVVFQSGVEERVWTGQGRLRVGRYWVVWALAGGASTEPVKISITPDRPPPTRPAALSRYG